MSYPSFSGYYDSSKQQSNNGNHVYQPSARNANGNMYGNHMNNSSSSAQQDSYASSGYGWSNQSSYPNPAATRQSNETYSQPPGYGYQRDGAYNGQSTSTNTSYPQDYYRQTYTGDKEQPPRSSTEGLSNLAYVSGLEANSMSNMARNTQTYEMQGQQQRNNRMQSPAATQSRYSMESPPISSSYPMRQQPSSSSTSSNQLAMDAAAALAGAVGRRNANNFQQPGLNATRNSPAASARTVTSSAPARTASPKAHSTSRPAQQYSLTPQQQQQQPQQQNVSASRAGTSEQSRSRQIPASVNTSDQPRATTNHTHDLHSRKSHGPTSTPRSVRQAGSIANLVTAVHENDSSDQLETPDTHDSAPTFIDPTSIFDPYANERERRRQAAEQAAIDARQKAEEEARRKAEEDAKLQEQQRQAELEARRKKLEEEAESRKRQATAKSSKGKKGAAPASAHAAQTEEERMAAELKAMMEKMKAFQSKDPSLFKKLWDDMRKPAPATAGPAMGTPSPQPTQQPAQQPDSATILQPSAPIRAHDQISIETPTQTPTQHAGQSTDRSTSKHRRKPPQTGEQGQPLFLNGYPVVVENNPEGLPDLGRFPAERRIRHKYAKKVPKSVNDAANEGDQSPSSQAIIPQTVTTPTSIPRPASLAAPGSTPAALIQAFQPSNDTTGGSGSSAVNSNSDAGTIWPLEKRNALTSTALRALKANPENANTPLTEDDLGKILETNPSYIDLCKELEGRGLKFHRGHFARELLNSVPDLKSGTPSSQPIPNVAAAGQPTPPSSMPRSQPQPPPPPTTWYNTCAPPIHNTASAQQPPYNYPAHGTLSGQFVPAPTQYGPVQPPRGYQQRHIPPPGSKEAAARKRDFSELIDLTDLGDDENYVTPSKHPRLEGPDSGDEMGAEAFQAYQRKAQPIAAYGNTPFGYLQPTTQPLPLHAQTGQIHRQESFPESKGIRQKLAKPLNKEEALKKQYYDPKTVARDILVATGRHPSERPLNVHLAGMLGRFIELDSDVNTFEWDEVDPGGPPAPKVEVIDVPASKPRFKLGDRVYRRNKTNGSPIDKTRRLETEKRPRAKPSTTSLTAHDLSNSSLPITPTSLLEDPSVQDAFRKPTSKLRHSLLASDEQATPATFDPTRPQIESDRVQSTSLKKSTTNMSQEMPVRRKPGRPPGSKNKAPSVAAMKAQAGDVRINVPHRDLTTSTKDRFKCKWKKCSTVLHNLDTLRKHIGRVHRPNPSDNSESYACWWKKCKHLKQDEETGEWVTTKTFDHWEDWLKHIEKEHVSPIAMRWGDGPATSHIDPMQVLADRTTYLSEPTGLETTPTITLANNHTLPSDTLNLTELDHRLVSTHAMTDKQKADEGAYIAYMRNHGINLKRHEESREASKEVLRAFAKRKERIGPGIDRGGCTLVTEAMRETFVQNPGIRRLVSEEK